jgi:DNA polymerase-4
MAVSLGGGTNRLIAKLAVERAKPKPGTGADGVWVVPEGGEASFLATITLGDIPGVGPRFRDRLTAAGLTTVPHVLAMPADRLRRAVGERAAEWLLRRVHGIDGSEVRARELAKSVSHEETFGRDIHSDDDLARELVDLTRRVSYHLRRDGLMARTVTVKLRDADFRTRSASRTLSAGVIADRVILEVAHRLLDKLRQARRVPARLLGVALSGLEEADVEAQLSLFDDVPDAVQETDKDRQLARAVDAVRARFGADALVPGRVADGARPRRR